MWYSKYQGVIVIIEISIILDKVIWHLIAQSQTYQNKSPNLYYARAARVTYEEKLRILWVD